MRGGKAGVRRYGCGCESVHLHVHGYEYEYDYDYVGCFEGRRA